MKYIMFKFKKYVFYQYDVNVTKMTTSRLEKFYVQNSKIMSVDLLKINKKITLHVCIKKTKLQLLFCKKKHIIYLKLKSKKKYEIIDKSF